MVSVAERSFKLTSFLVATHLVHGRSSSQLRWAFLQFWHARATCALVRRVPALAILPTTVASETAPVLVLIKVPGISWPWAVITGGGKLLCWSMSGGRG
jgi:hypothetical protein